MNEIALDELMGLQRYEAARPEFRRHIIALKKNRRVSVGDRVTFVFENRDTVLFQIQEMLRAEQIVDLDRVRQEVEVYNALLPRSGELSATMFIEITEADRVRDELLGLIGIDECVRMEIGGRFSISAQFEPGRSTADKLSAVQYVRFALDHDARDAFVHGTEPVSMVIEHPNYRCQTLFDDAVRASLAADLDTV